MPALENDVNTSFPRKRVTVFIHKLWESTAQTSFIIIQSAKFRRFCLIYYVFGGYNITHLNIEIIKDLNLMLVV